MTKLRIKAASLKNRITGISISATGGGISFKPKEADRDIIRKLIVFLEDKRALYITHDREIPDYVRMSLSQIREAVTEALREIGEDSPAVESLRVLRAACASFEAKYGHLDWRNRNDYDEDFFIRLGILRSVFGHQIAALAYAHKIDLDEGLASILPPEA